IGKLIGEHSGGSLEEDRNTRRKNARGYRIIGVTGDHTSQASCCTTATRFRGSFRWLYRRHRRLYAYT
ncbi:hypothetical protein GW17_00061221, partial [Ensete ventricosum]